MTAMPGLVRAEYTNGYEIGVGVSSFVGQARGSAIQWDSDPTGPTAGFSTDVAIDLATTQEDFFRSLGISAEVSASYGLGSVSAKTSYAESFKSTKLSSWIVVRVSVTQVYSQLGPHNRPALTPDALAILTGEGGALQFFQTYGDLYVAGIDAGAELLAVLQIDSTSDEAKQEVKASWDASYSGGFSAATKGEIDNVLSSAKTSSSKVFRCRVVGGPGGALPAQLTLEDLIDFGLKFPSTVTKENAVPLTVYLQDYRALYRPPGTHLSSPELDAAKALLSSVNGDIRALRAGSGAVQAILDHPERYTDTLADLHSRYQPAIDAIAAAIAAFTSLADTCVESFTNSDTPQVPPAPATPEIAVELPAANPDAVYAIFSALGLYGHDGLRLLVAGHDGQQAGAPVVLQTYDPDNPGQRWIRKELGDGRVQFVAGDTKEPIVGASADSGAPRLLFCGGAGITADATGAAWTATPYGGGDTWFIAAPDGVWSIKNRDGVNGTPIVIAAQDSALNDDQRWVFVPVGAPPPARPSGAEGVVLYADPNWTGVSRSFGPGGYDQGDLGTFDDAASSVRVPKGWTVTLYADPGFSGDSRQCTSDVEFLKEIGFDDATSSLKVSPP